jgi:hypothetical protein
MLPDSRLEKADYLNGMISQTKEITHAAGCYDGRSSDRSEGTSAGFAIKQACACLALMPSGSQVSDQRFKPSALQPIA